MKNKKKTVSNGNTKHKAAQLILLFELMMMFAEPCEIAALTNNVACS